MQKIRALYTVVLSFLASLIGVRSVPSLTTPAAVASQVTKRPTIVRSQRTRLRARLERIDGGGKHYGSKRAGSNHRGSQRGKRSGRA